MSNSFNSVREISEGISESVKVQSKRKLQISFLNWKTLQKLLNLSPKRTRTRLSNYQLLQVTVGRHR